MLVVWVDEDPLYFYITVERQDRSYHWRTKLERPWADYDFLTYLVGFMVDEIVNLERAGVQPLVIGEL